MKREDQHGQTAKQAESARTQADELREWLARTAGSVAATEEKIAHTLDRIADSEPHRATRLRKLSEHARQHAEDERRWAEDHTDGSRRPGADEPS
jgi:hypothetical protein